MTLSHDRRSELLAGCPLFGAGSEWNRDISGDVVDQATPPGLFEAVVGGITGFFFGG